MKNVSVAATEPGRYSSRTMMIVVELVTVKHTDSKVITLSSGEIIFIRDPAKLQLPNDPGLNIAKKSALTLWTPEDGIPTFRKCPNAAKLRYTVQMASYKPRRPTVYHRYGS